MVAIYVFKFACLASLAIMTMLAVAVYKTEDKTLNFLIAGGSFLDSIAIYVFMNVVNIADAWHNLFLFCLAVSLCVCGTLLGNAFFLKSSSNGQPSPQECCHCGDNCPNKKKCTCPIFPNDFTKKACLLGLGDFCPAEDDDSSRGGSGLSE